MAEHVKPGVCICGKIPRMRSTYSALDKQYGCDCPCGLASGWCQSESAAAARWNKLVQAMTWFDPMQRAGREWSEAIKKHAEILPYVVKLPRGVHYPKGSRGWELLQKETDAEDAIVATRAKMLELVQRILD